MRRQTGWQSDHNALGSLKARDKAVDGVNDFQREHWSPRRSIRPEAQRPAYYSYRDLLDRSNGGDED